MPAATAGCTPENDVPVDSKFVSRHHWPVYDHSSGTALEDLNTNGVFVKGKRVRRHALNDGDIITLGKHELIYVDERPARNAPDFGSTAVYDPGPQD